jgi:CRISPR-associated protein Cas5t
LELAKLPESFMIVVRISAPFASFKHSYSREYAESYPVPPPSTLYGCFLSLVGETDRTHHKGVKIAIALESSPKSTTVLRTFRRLKKPDLNAKENARPDFQDVLCGLEIVVCVDSTEDPHNLESRIEQALTNPEKLVRFGGLSLGESRDLINDIQLLNQIPDSLEWLVPNSKGKLKLPYWVDYLGSKDTRWERFTLLKFCEQAFCQIT